MIELVRALAVLVEVPTRETARVAEALDIDGTPTAADYTELFVLDLQPYASIYLGDEALIGGEARDRVAGFWRAIGATPPHDPDHLAALLGLYAGLHSSAGPLQARRALLWEHLLSWLPPYLTKAAAIGSPFYAQWASVLLGVLVHEAERTPSRGLVPLHLRATAGVVDPREAGFPAFLGSLLAPARSGMILSRPDLVRAARELELGMRVGGRRFALRELISQDAAGVLAWLAHEANHWSALHRAHPDPFKPVADVWAARAERSAALLDELSLHAAETRASAVLEPSPI